MIEDTGLQEMQLEMNTINYHQRHNFVKKLLLQQHLCSKYPTSLVCAVALHRAIFSEP